MAYIRDAIRTMRTHDVRHRRAARGRAGRWNDDLQRRMKRTVWTTGGCSSWYLDAHGKNTVLWPRTHLRLPAAARRFDVEAYDVEAGPRPAGGHWHEDARRQGRRDHRRRLRHRPRARPSTLARQGALLALSDVDEPASPRPSTWSRRRRRRGPHRPPRRGRPRRRWRRTPPTVAEHFGRVNVVVNNAGVALAGRLRGDELRGLRLDRRHQLLGRRARHQGVPAAPDRLRRRALVNISSLFGLVSMPGQSAYNATKYAVRGFTEALREEMLIAGHPVGVTAVHPGGIKTAIARNARVPGQRGPGRDRRRSSTRSSPR